MTKPWVILDGDNTLWDIESSYDDARDRFVRTMYDLGFDKNLVEEFQRRQDAQLFADFGYSKKRFAKSFELTLFHFLPHTAKSRVKSVRKIANSVFNTKPRLFDEVIGTIACLKEEFKIGLLTSGPFDLQSQKINLALAENQSFFDAIEIVKKKTDNVFLSFCQKNNVDISESWMVGDSIVHDVEPALRIGMNAIHVNNNNWRELEGSKSLFNFSSVPNISEIIPLVQQRQLVDA